MKKSNVFSEFIKPILVLVIFCAAAGALLGYVNHLTEPVIEENAVKKAEEARKEALPGSAGFEEEPDIDYEGLQITGFYCETSGNGYVITASSQGYGGAVIVTAGLSPDGVIQNLVVDLSTETKGVGTKAGEESYLANYIGKSGNVSDVDTRATATYSSTAIKTAVSNILNAYNTVVEGGRQ